MAIIKCKMCGGNLDIVEEMTVAECEYCGTKQTVPHVDDEKKITLFSRANRLRFAGEFDKATGIYENIVAEFPTEAEAYWGLVLCRYGIEYVDDPASGIKVPTCHRSSFESLMEDSNFEQACENADPIARRVYRDEAKTIEELRKAILEVSEKEEPYDVFICYKETAENGDRTIDSVIAQDVYDALTEKGYQVFFSRISLEDKLGVEYEPYIFAALNSAKVMLVFGTDYEYFNAVWVKNEWSRFLALISAGQKKVLIPCFKDVDAYDMPKEFAHLQAQDMGKVGAIQDLLRGISKIVPTSLKSQEGDEDDCSEKSDKSDRNYEDSDDVLTWIKRGLLYLEDEEWDEAYECFDDAMCYSDDGSDGSFTAYIGRTCAQLGLSSIEEFEKGYPTLPDRKNYKTYICSVDIKAGYIQLSEQNWESAEEFFDSALETNPECAIAYVGKMMAENGISEEDNIADYFYGKGLDITEDKNYKKALRFAEAEYLGKLESYNKPQSPAETTSTETMERLAEIRKQNQKYKCLILANGDRTVGIKDYGEVLAVGDNRHGECNTGAWQDVVSVALGSFHTVGLKKNGTVVAAGGQGGLANSGQCQTSGWSDITAIAAASSFTIGLKANGSFVHCGDAIRGRIENGSASGILAGVAKNILGQMIIPKSMDWSAVYAGPGEIYGLTKDGRVETINHYGTGDRWRNVIEVVPSADGDTVIALCKDGTVVATGKNEHGQCDVKNWRDIVAVVTGGSCIYEPFTVGLKADGTVLATGSNKYRQCRVSDWTDIVAIATGANHTVGLKSNGTVVAVGQNEDRQCNTSDWHDIVAIVAGDNHTVGLKADGTVVAVGSNEYGQCNTQEWSEIGVVDPEKQQERDFAESYRLRLVSIRDEMKQRKKKMEELRAKLKPNFDSPSVCLNCGRKHFGEVKICKECGAVFESGVGARGIKYRQYRLDNQGATYKIFRDGWTECIIPKADGQREMRKLRETGDYFEYYMDSADKQNSEMIGLDHEGVFYILLNGLGGLSQTLSVNGVADLSLLYKKDNNSLIEAQQIIFPGGAFTLKGTCVSLIPQRQEQNEAAAQRVRLISLRDELTRKKDKMLELRSKLTSHFYDYKYCLNCGANHSSETTICKACGATFKSGVGNRGVKYRSYTLKDSSAIGQIFEDGWTDWLTTEKDGRRKLSRLTNENTYAEYYLNSSNEQDGDLCTMYADGKTVVEPSGGNGILQNLLANGTAYFNQLKGSEKAGVTQIVYPNDMFTFESVNKSIFNTHAGNQSTEAPAIKLCPKCNKENKPNAKFCKHCGAAMQKAGVSLCPSCGSELKSGKKFCSKCGAKIN